MCVCGVWCSVCDLFDVCLCVVCGVMCDLFDVFMYFVVQCV